MPIDKIGGFSNLPSNEGGPKKAKVSDQVQKNMDKLVNQVKVQEEILTNPHNINKAKDKIALWAKRHEPEYVKVSKEIKADSDKIKKMREQLQSQFVQDGKSLEGRIKSENS